MSPLANAALGAIGALIGSRLAASERRHGERFYYHPRIATAWLTFASLACAWGVVDRGVWTWEGALLACLTLFGLVCARDAAGQAWSERKASRKAGGK